MDEAPTAIEVQAGLVRVPVRLWKKSLEWIVADPVLKTKIYLHGFNTTYFSYLLDVHGKNLEAEETKFHAATALRQLYMQLLETTMAFFGALVQAPNAVPMWMQKYTNSDLEAVIQCLVDGDTLPGRVAPVDFEQLALQFSSNFQIHGNSEGQRDLGNLQEGIKINLPRILRHLMQDFLDQDLGDEYNSIKHGLRISSGSNALSIRAIGLEESFTLENAFSSEFPVLIERSRADKQYSLGHVSVGFDPMNTVYKIASCIQLLDFLWFQVSLSTHGQLASDVRFPEEEQIVKGWEKPPENTGLLRFADQF